MISKAKTCTLDFYNLAIIKTFIEKDIRDYSCLCAHALFFGALLSDYSSAGNYVEYWEIDTVSTM